MVTYLPRLHLPVNSWLWSQRFLKIHSWWNGFAFSPLMLISFWFLSKEPLEVKKLDHKHCHHWAPMTKCYNVKAQCHQACQMFIGDHTAEETPWLCRSCLVRLREAGESWCFRRSHPTKASCVGHCVRAKNEPPLFSVPTLSLCRENHNCCFWQTTHCLFRSQERRTRLGVSTILASYPPIQGLYLFQGPEIQWKYISAVQCLPFPL